MTLEVDVRHAAGDFALRARFTVPTSLAVLFGPSGAGKSLTLRLLAGLDRPVDGRIACDGEVLVDTRAGVWQRPRERQVGMVFQEPLLLPHRTALGNVALAVRGGSRRSRGEVALGWLDRVGAADLAHRRPAGLSGGQRQRVSLARALAGRPRLLLLDEPFNALDLPVRRQLRGLVRTLVDAERLTAVFVTHDHDEAAALADHVILADPGDITRVEAPAPPADRTTPAPLERHRDRR